MRWVIQGFKKDEDITETSSPNSQPPPSNVIKDSGETFNNDFSDEISEEKLKTEYEKSK